MLTMFIPLEQEILLANPMQKDKMKSGSNDKGEPIRTKLRGISKPWNFALIGTDANRDFLTGEPMVCIPLALLAS